jgi:hypothetical protein
MIDIIETILSSLTLTVATTLFLFSVIYVFIIVMKEHWRKFVGLFILLEPEETDEYKPVPLKRPSTSTEFCRSCGAPYIQKNGCTCGRH